MFTLDDGGSYIIPSKGFIKMALPSKVSKSTLDLLLHHYVLIKTMAMEDTLRSPICSNFKHSLAFSR